MNAAVVIPARYASTRLPGKPLLRETGKYLVQHVYERASLSRRADTVLVATDDPRIVAAVESFGGNVVLTGRSHPTGTDRVAEVARRLDSDVVVNLQGDEPLVEPESLDLLVDLLARRPDAGMATLAAPLDCPQRWRSPHCVKVVCDHAGRALYFTRSPVPFVRDGEPDFAERPPRFLQHVGTYAYRREFLLRLSALPPAPLERLEQLEQLRAVAAGCRMPVGLVARPTLGVDTYDDYRRFVETYRQAQPVRAA